jgi:N6-adenosine-specific RNA methylase IME4
MGLGLSPKTIVASERISHLPADEKTKAYRETEKQDVLPTVEFLLDASRPYWMKDNRGQKHKSIAAKASPLAEFGNFGPFPLLYADPPTKFATHSENGLDRSPDQHYPTLTWDEVSDFKVGGLFISEIAMKNAALLMWCTSSNIHHALKVMEAWDFEFKSSAVWVKMTDAGKLQLGTGFVFRNAHEILLYGTRGNIPAPQFQPPSVFVYPRGAHSAKPPEVRKLIEKMYPDFDDERTRCELFARGAIKGWTSHGLEAMEREDE